MQNQIINFRAAVATVAGSYDMFRDYPDVLSVRDLTKMLDIGTSSAYNLVQNNEIDHIRIGRKYKIPKQSLINYLCLPRRYDKVDTHSRLVISEEDS